MGQENGWSKELCIERCYSHHSDQYYTEIAGTVDMPAEELSMLVLTRYDSIYMNKVSHHYAIVYIMIGLFSHK